MYAQFINYFTDFLDGKTLQSNYLHVKTKCFFSANSLSEAKEKYQWNGDFQNNNNFLEELKNKIRISLKNNDKGTLEDNLKKLMKWGGTIKGNNQAIEELINDDNFLELMQYVEIANKNVDVINSDVPSFFRSNAGFTKIYSLAIDNYVIYDSRVAATICCFIRDYCTKFNTTPEKSNLNLCWMEGRAGYRNPCTITTYFNKITPAKDNLPSNLAHFRSNLLANHILTSAIAQSKISWTLRELEAALFMIGYDISHFRLKP